MYLQRPFCHGILYICRFQGLGHGHFGEAIAYHRRREEEDGETFLSLKVYLREFLTFFFKVKFTKVQDSLFNDSFPA